jgi:hypothetical protein
MGTDIEAADLTTFEIAPDGSRFRICVVDIEGQPASLGLPTDCLPNLIMTLPRMAAQALRARNRGDSLRIVYPADRLRLEQGDVAGILILTLTTPDGFEVSFGVRAGDLVQVQRAAGSPDPAAERPRLLKH